VSGVKFGGDAELEVCAGTPQNLAALQRVLDPWHCCGSPGLCGAACRDDPLSDVLARAHAEVSRVIAESNPQTAAAGEGTADAPSTADPVAVESGTPDLTPGVLEDGGSARVGDLTPPGSDVGPTVDPPSSPDSCPEYNEAVDKCDPGSTGPPAAPASLTDQMRVERCRVLIDQWRADRLAIALDYGDAGGAYRTFKACEDELREALGDQT
jgi:hypothetical protein